METYNIFSAIGLCFIGALLIVWHNIYRMRSLSKVAGNNSATEESKNSNSEVPLPDWLTGEDIIRYYDLSHDLLMQYVRNGLPVYPSGTDVLYHGDYVPPLKEDDLVFEVLDDDYSTFRFKKADIQEFMKNKIT